MSVVKVLRVDDSPVSREKISLMLSIDSEIQVLGIADGAESAKEKIAALKPEVLILSLKHGHNSAAFVRAVSTQSTLPVVVITEATVEPFEAVKSVDFVKMPLIRTATGMQSFMQRLAQKIKAASKTKVSASSNAANAPANLKASPEPAKTAPSVSELAARAKRDRAEAAAEAEAAAKARAAAVEAEAAAKERAERAAAESAAKAKAERAAAESAAKAKAERAAAESAAKAKAAAEPTVSETSDPAAKAFAAATAAKQKILSPFSPKGKCHVIALGASTGGTEALQTVLQDLPDNTPGILIVQHMPEMFTKMYADRLNRVCKMRCIEARDGERVEVGKIILGAGNYHLRLARDSKGYYVTSQHGEKVSGHCPSVDVLFQSVAEVAGKDAIGAIFTGMGADGAVGLKKMRDAGAFTIGQDQSTCVVYGMPMVAYNMGAVCRQAPLDKIPQIILENC